MSTVAFLWQIYLTELKKLLTYRVSFWLNFLGTLAISLIVSYSVWKHIFEIRQVKTLQGMSFNTLLSYYLIAPIVAKAIRGSDVGFVSHEIYDGHLTKYLLYPQSFFPIKLASYLSKTSIFLGQLFILSFVFSLFFPNADTLPPSLSQLVLGGLAVFFAALLYFNLSLIIELISFWAENVWSLQVMLRMMTLFLGGAMIPLNFFPTWAQTILEYTPFPFLVSLPCQIYLGLPQSIETLPALAIAGFWILLSWSIAKLIWIRGLRAYSGVGI